MSISRDTIAKVAHLARINLDEASIPGITQSISDILTLIDKMQAVDTVNVEPLANPHDATQRLREDVVTAADEREKLLRNAPASEAGLFLVPKVIE